MSTGTVILPARTIVMTDGGTVTIDAATRSSTYMPASSPPPPPPAPPPPPPPPPPGTAWSISTDWSSHGNTGGWWAYQNPWNTQYLSGGETYSQTLSGNTPPFPGGTTIAWTWPNRANPDNVWGYPELVFGAQPYGGSPPVNNASGGPSPIQISSLGTLTGTYDITLSGDVSTYDVLWETHLTNTPAGAAIYEFSVLVHTPQFFRDYLTGQVPGYAFSSGGWVGHIYMVNSTYSIAMLDTEPSGTHLTGTFDLLAYLNSLIANGHLSGNEYICGFEMGAEPQQGSASFTINSISYNWNGTTYP